MISPPTGLEVSGITPSTFVHVGGHALPSNLDPNLSGEERVAFGRESAASKEYGQPMAQRGVPGAAGPTAG